MTRRRSPASPLLFTAGYLVVWGAAGALAFARERGIARVVPTYHVTRAARAALARELARRRADAHAAASRATGGRGGGTVGAVARDARGAVAAATSTGGMVGK
ncbi:MAG: isoaspartyl peptidase/L-asparaginase, partial [Pyrinomonadaceae bacterium]